jgi:hypothetical protein
LRQVVNGPEPINRRFRICFMASTLYAWGESLGFHHVKSVLCRFRLRPGETPRLGSRISPNTQVKIRRMLDAHNKQSS